MQMRKTMAEALVVATAIGLVTTPASSSADSIQPFEVWNLSSADITVSFYDTDPNKKVISYIPTVPPVGTVIKPGNKLHVDTPYFDADHGRTCTRTIPRLSGRGSSTDGQAQYWRIVWEYPIMIPARGDCQGTSNGQISCGPVGNPPPSKQTASCGKYIGGNVATVADGPGGMFIDVPVSDKAKQDEINQAFCQNPYRDQLSITCKDSPDAMMVYAGWTTWTLHHK
jgi:hypothetical protein